MMAVNRYAWLWRVAEVAFWIGVLLGTLWLLSGCVSSEEVTGEWLDIWYGE